MLEFVCLFISIMFNLVLFLFHIVISLEWFSVIRATLRMAHTLTLL